MVIYSSDSGLILVVCSLLIECLLATLIWHQNLAVPATQLTPSHVPSHLPSHVPSHLPSHVPSHLTSQYALILAFSISLKRNEARSRSFPKGLVMLLNLPGKARKGTSTACSVYVRHNCQLPSIQRHRNATIVPAKKN